MGDLGGRAAGRKQKMLILSAVAVLHSDQDVLAVVGGLKSRFSNARKLLAQDIPVFGGAGTDHVVVDLLVEIRILRGTLISLGKARVIESAIVAGPGHIAAGSSKVHTRNRIANLLASGDIEDVKRCILAASGARSHPPH